MFWECFYDQGKTCVLGLLMSFGLGPLCRALYIFLFQFYIFLT